MASKIILLFLLVVVSISCGDYSRQKKGLEIRSDESSMRIDYVFKGSDSKRRPGYAVAVMHEGEVVHSAGYGMANFEEGLAISPITSFENWTMLGEMINVAVLKLAEEGDISLGDPLVNYIPELSVILSSEVTVEHLLKSTSGLAYAWDILDEKGLSNSQMFLQCYLEAEDSVLFAPGESCTFSGLEVYHFGSLIIEDVSGLSLDSYLEETFFTPLGMENTSIAMDGHGPSADVLNYRRRTDGYYPIKENEQEYYPKININLQDIIKWYTALDEGSIISNEMLDVYYQRVAAKNGVSFQDETNFAQQFYTGYWSMAGYCIETSAYGLIRYSNGSNDPYGSISLYYPEQEFRVFVYSNIPGARIADYIVGFFIPLVAWEWLYP